jgi:hypothetical protein
MNKVKKKAIYIQKLLFYKLTALFFYFVLFCIVKIIKLK